MNKTLRFLGWGAVALLGAVAVGAIALLVIVGIVFTCARAITKTVLASYLLHVSYNFSVSFAFLLGSHWLRLVSPGH